MGVINLTPDSFSEGGTPDPLATGRAMLASGAAIIDVGGESTRPGAIPVTPGEEQARILPTIAALVREGAVVSVDTRNASTMTAALDAGAQIVNDVSALTHDPAAALVVAKRRCPVILMHMRGTPATMMAHAEYDDPVAAVAEELRARMAAAIAAGIQPDAIALDPGIGFAKRTPHNVELLARLGELRALDRPLVVGVSRKRFIGELAGEPDPARRDPGSIAAALFAATRGAAVLRVHDVAGTAQALRVWRGIAGLG